MTQFFLDLETQELPVDANITTSRALGHDVRADLPPARHPSRSLSGSLTEIT